MLTLGVFVGEQVASLNSEVLTDSLASGALLFGANTVYDCRKRKHTKASV